MTTNATMDLQALLEKTTDSDFLRKKIDSTAQRLMELEAESLADAPLGSRNADGLTQRNGYRARTWETRAGTIELRIPKQAFLNRPLRGNWPYLWLDATYVKVRQAGRIVSAAVIIAVGTSEAETFWTDFLRSLARRGLRGVKLVISDAHEGLKAAIAKVLRAPAWRLARLPGKSAARQARRPNGVSAMPPSGWRV